MEGQRRGAPPIKRIRKGLHFGISHDFVKLCEYSNSSMAKPKIQSFRYVGKVQFFDRYEIGLLDSHVSSSSSAVLLKTHNNNVQCYVDCDREDTMW